jgi:hypothetical protein
LLGVKQLPCMPYIKSGSNRGVSHKHIFPKLITDAKENPRNTPNPIRQTIIPMTTNLTNPSVSNLPISTPPLLVVVLLVC